MYSLLGNDGSIIAVSTFNLLPDNQIPYDHDRHHEDWDMIIELDGGNDLINTKTDYHLYVSFLLASEWYKKDEVHVNLTYTPFEPGDSHFDNCVRIEIIDMDGFCYVIKTRMAEELPYALFYLHDNYPIDMDIIKIRKVDCQIDCSQDVQLSILSRSHDVLFHSQEILDFYTKKYSDVITNEIFVH